MKVPSIFLSLDLRLHFTVQLHPTDTCHYIFWGKIFPKSISQQTSSKFCVQIFLLLLSYRETCHVNNGLSFNSAEKAKAFFLQFHFGEEWTILIGSLALGIACACVAGVRKGRGRELGREKRREGGGRSAPPRPRAPKFPLPLPFLTSATQATITHRGQSAFKEYETMKS